MSNEDQPEQGTIDARTLQIIKNLNIIPDMMAGARYTGIHSSTDRGGDVEFAEHRQYEPGDDLRHLDWNALAKTDDLFLKQYESETQITGKLFLDGSNSMDFASGDVNKWETARAVSVLLASTLINQQDNVEITLSREKSWGSGNLTDFGDLKQKIPYLEEQSPSGPTTLLSDLRKTSTGERALWMIVSDFWIEDVETMFRWLRGFKERGHDAVLVPVWDPLERTFEPGGSVELRDVETGDKLHVGKDDREHFQQALESHRKQIRNLAHSTGLAFWPFYTDQPIFEQYREFVLEEQR